MAKVEDGSLDTFRPQKRNLNRHSQRGMGALESSMRKHGYVAPITVAADGEVIDGSARLETVANVFDDDVIVVHHTGDRPIVMVRDDIPNASTNEAREISALANRISEINLEWDAEELFADLQSGVDFSSVFNQSELDELLAGLVAPEPVDDPNEHWKGMPEFEQEDKMGIQSIHVHFNTREDVDAFAELIGQKLTDKTRSIWYPQAEIERYADKAYQDES